MVDPNRSLRHVVTAGIGAILCVAVNAACAKDQVIHAGHLLDGVSKSPRTEVSILIHEDRITGLQAGYVSPPVPR